jgi:calreticulin
MEIQGRKTAIIALFIFLSLAAAKIHFHEQFNPGWESRWTKTKWKEEQQGAFKSTLGKWYGDEEMAHAIQTSENGKFYDLSAKFDKVITNKENPLVVQYSVKFEQVIDCGGGYVKVVAENFDQSNFGGDTPLLIMFGPDICGSDNKVHLILDHNGKGYLWKKKPTAPNDKLTHIYTAVLYPNGSYAVYLDAKPLENGTVFEDWDFSVPKELPDPNDKKPEDWDEQMYIPDPNDKRPEDWVDEEMIVDKDATKPDDWDDKREGDWQPPKVKNPNYKGPWEAKKIYNPKYKGVWSPKMIPNPDYKPSEVDVYHIGGIGFDVWQVKAGTIFDNVLIADSLKEALAEAELILEKQVSKELEYKEVEDKEQQKLADEAREKMKAEQKTEEKKPDL